MPRILQSPREYQPISLDCEAHKPEADRITWTARALSRSELADYEAEYARIVDLQYTQQLEPLTALIQRVASGWENVVDADDKPLPFNQDSFGLFTPQELLVIARQLPDAAGWGGAVRKKKLASPSP